MKVFDSHLTGTPSLPRPAGAGQPMGISSSGPAKNGDRDRVEFSGFAGRLGPVLAAQSQDRAARVAALERTYQGGRYTPDPRQVSQALVRETLAAAADREGA